MRTFYRKAAKKIQQKENEKKMNKQLQQQNKTIYVKIQINTILLYVYVVKTK